MRAAPESGSLVAGLDRYPAEVHWQRFWGIQVFVTTMLFMFVASREFIIAVGADRSRQLFFGQ